MKVSSNKSKSKSKSVKSSKGENTISSSSSENKPRYGVEQITNGFIIDKSWSDKDGRYHSTKTYSETNPLDKEDTK